MASLKLFFMMILITQVISHQVNDPERKRVNSEPKEINQVIQNRVGRKASYSYVMDNAGRSRKIENFEKSKSSDREKKKKNGKNHGSKVGKDEKNINKIREGRRKDQSTAKLSKNDKKSKSSLKTGKEKTKERLINKSKPTTGKKPKHLNKIETQKKKNEHKKFNKSNKPTEKKKSPKKVNKSNKPLEKRKGQLRNKTNSKVAPKHQKQDQRKPGIKENSNNVRKIPMQRKKSKNPEEASKLPNENSKVRGPAGPISFLPENLKANELQDLRLVAHQENQEIYITDGMEGIVYSINNNFELNYLTYIMAPEGTTISIVCPHFDLAPKGKPCKDEYVTMYDGDVSSSVTQTFCQRDSVSFTTSSNVLTLYHYRKDLKKNKCTGGFICTFKAGGVPSDHTACTTHKLQTDGVQILYSSNDGSKKKCKQTVQIPTGNQLHMICLNDMNPDGCSKESLTVKTKPKQKFCTTDEVDIMYPSETLKFIYKRKPLRKRCSGGYLCYFSAIAPVVTPGPAPGPDPGPNPGPDPGPNPGPDPSPNPGPDPGPNPGPAPGPAPASSPLCAGCGISTKDVLPPRIVNGQAAESGSIPWQVLLDFSTSTTTTICGGSLISREWILTAAHCVVGYDVTTFIIYLGVTKRSEIEQDTDVQAFTVVESVTHENYDDQTVTNDIALLKLDRPATLTDSVRTICIPRQDEHIHGPGDHVVVAGWGTNSFGTSNIADNLEVVGLNEISLAECISKYSGSLEINSKMMCTYTETKDACQGDSGGPLVKFVGGRWIQIGIVSFGDGCAKEDKPGVFTNLIKYHDWIQSKIAGYTCS